ncbi:Kinesin-like protein tea2 [Neolecta irregularis DAH-3]|uniref:Kinesin-like protein n=1 Tax=Neolecta irregularis (strain DAH-3) TaxID=1198029 RepID=A0A1U7LU92_NEOID|nr:Kinesin-like protein tea2 [Neolecta irregularis DAH-3]|eukprot:OLL26214.1 Kinesin-like protein tea2 [Neolecta irregularis DAH-3]
MYPYYPTDSLVKTTDRAFAIKVSYLEIYNEQIRDLLADPCSSSEEIKLREDRKRGVYATPLTEIQVSSADQIMAILERGQSSRRTAATTLNDLSSRSHAILNVLIESREASIGSKRGGMVTSGLRTSVLSLIDLAGSERADKNEERRKEGAYINKSLLTLGTVIARLSSPNSTNHIPFRDSKLTRLLQYSLSGNGLISVLATMSDSPPSVTESFNTLKFASRIKYIPTKHLEKDEQHFDSSQFSMENQLLKNKIEQLEQTLELERQQFQENLSLLSISQNSYQLKIAFLESGDTIHSQDLSARISELEDQIISYPSPNLLKEKDLEIAELKAELDDKDTIISALRRANRKREVAELTSVERLFSPDKDSKKRRYYLVERRSVS